MLKLTRVFCLFGVLVFSVAATGMAAETIDNQVLLEEIRGLRAKVAEMDVMEKRLADLEAIITAQSTAAAAPATATVSVDESAKSTIKEVVEEVFAEKQPISFGGAMRFNYGYKDWSEDQDDKYGDAGFDLFRVNADGAIGDWILSAEYRFYSYFNTVHHAYVGYNVNDNWQVQAGIQQVPFGLQPYASHNFWFSGAYYVGLEDDYDMGVKGLYSDGPLDFTLAFYKNGELGNSGSTDRYSIDVISNANGGYAGAQADGNEETNQFNGRLAYTFDHGDLGDTELGVSGQWGQLYNQSTHDTGDHWATGLHMNGNYGNWNVQLEAVTYEYNPENPATFTNADEDIINTNDDIITMGAFTYSWGAPAEADIWIANVAYTIPTDLKWLDSITLYSDNTMIDPSASNQPTIWQNVVGAMFASGPVYTYLDIVSAENMIFSNGNMVDETVRNNDERTTRLNLNVGYYW